MKLKVKSEVVRYKITLVARGFLQRKDIDFEEVFALVAKIKTIKLVVVIISINNWFIYQMDVKFSFLNRPLDKEIFCCTTSWF